MHCRGATHLRVVEDEAALAAPRERHVQRLELLAQHQVAQLVELGAPCAHPAAAHPTTAPGGRRRAGDTGRGSVLDGRRGAAGGGGGGGGQHRVEHVPLLVRGRVGEEVEEAHVVELEPLALLHREHQAVAQLEGQPRLRSLASDEHRLVGAHLGQADLVCGEHHLHDTLRVGVGQQCGGRAGEVAALRRVQDVDGVREELPHEAHEARRAVDDARVRAGWGEGEAEAEAEGAIRTTTRVYACSRGAHR